MTMWVPCIAAMTPHQLVVVRLPGFEDNFDTRYSSHFYTRLSHPKRRVASQCLNQVNICLMLQAELKMKYTFASCISIMEGGAQGWKQLLFSGGTNISTKQDSNSKELDRLEQMQGLLLKHFFSFFISSSYYFKILTIVKSLNPRFIRTSALISSFK